MVEIEFNEVRVLQKEILESVHSFCIDNNIQYFLSDGTLLGAVRHGGYIPWDDDIDITMPRKDYERFIRKFKHPRYNVVSLSNSKGYYLPFAKVIDNQTFLIENVSEKFQIGVNIDVFPLDNIPSDIKEKERLIKKRKRYSWCYNHKNRPVHSGKTWKSKIRILINNLFFSRFFRIQNIIEKIAILAKNWDNSNSDEKAILSFPIYSPVIYPAELFNEYIDIEFEGRKYRTIKDYKEYLTLTFGNWRKLPPEKHRVRTHSYKAYWKNK